MSSRWARGRKGDALGCAHQLGARRLIDARRACLAVALVLVTGAPARAQPATPGFPLLASSPSLFQFGVEAFASYLQAGSTSFSPAGLLITIGMRSS